jgi:nicotinamide-nucleotide amidase
MEPNERSLRQARVPEGVVVLHNLQGTAPGMQFDLETAHVYVLPGVPYEMKAMFDAHVAPALGRVVERIERVWTLHGIPESELAELLASFEGELPDRMSLAYLPSYGTIRLRLIESLASGGNRDELDQLASWLNAIVDEFVLTDRPEPIAATLGRLLQAEASNTAVAESCTGGMVGAELTAIPGSSAWFSGGVISYSNDAKSELLDVDPSLIERHGAVSGEVARAMASGALDRLASDLALSITGIAGPGGGTDEKPVGTVWIGCADAVGCSATLFRFNGSRDVVRRYSTNAAIATGIRRLTGRGDESLGGAAYRSA